MANTVATPKHIAATGNGKTIPRTTSPTIARAAKTAMILGVAFELELRPFIPDTFSKVAINYCDTILAGRQFR